MPAIPSTGGGLVWRMIMLHYKQVKGSGTEWEKMLEPPVKRKWFLVNGYLNIFEKRLPILSPSYEPFRKRHMSFRIMLHYIWLENPALVTKLRENHNPTNRDLNASRSLISFFTF
jgi:hypothetical protein